MKELNCSLSRSIAWENPEVVPSISLRRSVLSSNSHMDSGWYNFNSNYGIISSCDSTYDPVWSLNRIWNLTIERLCQIWIHLMQGWCLPLRLIVWCYTRKYNTLGLCFSIYKVDNSHRKASCCSFPSLKSLPEGIPKGGNLRLA